MLERVFKFMTTIIVNGLSREQRIAVLEGKQLEQIHIMNTHDQSLVNNIYLGSVEKVVPGMDAAFVHFGREKNAFIHKEDLVSCTPDKKEVPINQLVTQGEKILIQVVRDETEFKGARVTGFIEVSSPSLVYIPNQNYIALSKKFTPSEREKWKMIAEKYIEENEGLLIRTDMKEKDEAAFEDVLQACRKEYQEVLKNAKDCKVPSLLHKENHLIHALKVAMKNKKGKIIIDDFPLFLQMKTQCGDDWELIYHRNEENIFSAFNVDHQLVQLHKRVVWLDNGGFLVIEEGEAMTTIDVNTGKFIGKQQKTETILQTNVLAAKEAMRQIKLRNISGMILIDFINSNRKQDKDIILKEVHLGLKQDKTTTQVIGFTELGILQLTRKVTTASLLQYSSSACPTCHGTGRVENAQAAAFRLERELLSVRNSDYEAAVIELTRDVFDWFSGENIIFKQRLEDETGLKIDFVLVESEKPLFHIKQFIK